MGTIKISVLNKKLINLKQASLQYIIIGKRNKAFVSKVLEKSDNTFLRDSIYEIFRYETNLSKAIFLHVQNGKLKLYNTNADFCLSAKTVKKYINNQ